jgi:hypothetical protein
VAAGEESDEHLLDHAVLADDDARKLGLDLVDGSAETGDGTILFVVHVYETLGE